MFPNSLNTYFKNYYELRSARQLVYSNLRRDLIHISPCQGGD